MDNFSQSVYIYSVKHVPGSKNVVPDALSHQDHEVTHTDAEAIEAFPNLGVIAEVNKADHSGSDKQTKVQIDPNLQVMSRQPGKPVKDLKHMEATFGSSATPVWGEIKIKAPNKVNACRVRLRPELVQKAQENMLESDLSRNNIRREQSGDQECSSINKYFTLGMLPESDTDARSIFLRQEAFIMIDGPLYHIFTPTSSKPGAPAE